MSERSNKAQPTTGSPTFQRSRSARWPRRSGSDRGPFFARALSARGTALMETALTLPLLLLVSVGIFEFGRAYQTWQILTNAAREGARVAILPNSVVSDVQTRVIGYMRNGQLAGCDTTCVTVTKTTIAIGAANAPGSRVTINYPFQFIVLQPVAQLVQGNSSLGAGTLTLSASAEMRNEQ